ncbi:MAG: 4-hydroxythreonine-4-phosphate dehydrogenase [Bacteroidetes bacterium]|jgi:4-hydroxythreonine-4-phosphate dehydrogenase|nr:4-hydroxythreonine-4-phosphate dehydrogenase [Bacteroidota bacterium]
MSEEKIRVGITQGDINGIGLEIILKTFLEPGLCEICTPVLFSSQKTISFYKKALNLEELNFNMIRDMGQLHTKKPNVFTCYEEEVNIEPGKSTETGGKYALLSLEKACEALQNKQIDVLVTAPINKHTIQGPNFNFAGHTEYLAQKFTGKQNSLMLLCSDDLRVGLVTGHIPISQVAGAITTEKIVEKIKQLDTTLRKDFTIRKPKIAVLALNPHAGDNGAIGNEDDTIVKPAIDQLKDKYQVYGPYPSDGFFGNMTYKKFDAVLAMYHDQGLIPFKSIAFSDGVNYTADLPIVRTSPDHGTAFDIAGKGIADDTSLKKAIYMAIDIFRNRRLNQEISGNPLAFGKLKHE